MLTHCIIFCSSKKQHTISLSSPKAEYRGALNATTKCVWLQCILGELGFALDSPTIILCDNKSEINIFIDLVQIHRTKHIEIHMHQICILVHEQVISLEYCSSAEKIANIFTKRFTENTITYIRSLFGVGNKW